METLARVGETLSASTGAATPQASTRPLQMPVGDKTVAVLSFRNGGPPEDDYLADGVTVPPDGFAMLDEVMVAVTCGACLRASEGERRALQNPAYRPADT